MDDVCIGYLTPRSRFSGFALEQRRPPTVGEHTHEILAELGYGASDIQALRDRGTI